MSGCVSPGKPRDTGLLQSSWSFASHSLSIPCSGSGCSSIFNIVKNCHSVSLRPFHTPLPTVSKGFKLSTSFPILVILKKKNSHLGGYMRQHFFFFYNILLNTFLNSTLGLSPLSYLGSLKVERGLWRNYQSRYKMRLSAWLRVSGQALYSHKYLVIPLCALVRSSAILSISQQKLSPAFAKVQEETFQSPGWAQGSFPDSSFAVRDPVAYYSMGRVIVRHLQSFHGLLTHSWLRRLWRGLSCSHEQHTHLFCRLPKQWFTQLQWGTVPGFSRVFLGNG